MSIYIPPELEEAVVAYTDAGQWKHSWHWERDDNGRITIEDAKAMLVNLKCDGLIVQEVAEATNRIRKRYALAEELGKLILRAEAKEGLDAAENQGGA